MCDGDFQAERTTDQGPRSCAGAGDPSAWRSLVTRFEELASPIEGRPIGEVTEARYRQVRLRAEKVGWQAVLTGARSRSAHDVARAALARASVEMGRASVEMGRDLLARVGDQATGLVAQPWADALARVVAALEICRPVSEGGADWVPPVDGPRRMGKRRGLATLPADWRARMLAHTPEKGPYGLAIACLWLLGVRPGELVRGVRIQLAPDGTVLAEVEGGKQRRVPGEAPRGQPRRRLAVQAGPGSDEAVARLRRAITQAGTDTLVVQIADARRLSDALRATSRRVFPRLGYTISPYSFRHAWAADAKAGTASRSGGNSGSKSGARSVGQADGSGEATAGDMTRSRASARHQPDADDVSRALGHAAARTRSAYGTRSQSRGGGGRVTLVGVAATEPLRGAGREPFASKSPARGTTPTTASPSSSAELEDHVAILMTAMAAGVTDVGPDYDLSPPPSPPSSSSDGR